MQTTMDYQLDDVFRALVDSTRRIILQLLAKALELSASEFAKPSNMLLTAVSKPTAVLEKAHLARKKKHGRSWLCRLNREAMMSAEE